MFAQGTINPSFFYTSPPTPVGSGARAMGVGGAFIAVADDATAANWNPAALIQLELPEASFVLDSDYRHIGEQTAQFYDVNYLSASYPFTVKNVNMILSLNYQRLFDSYLNFDKKLKDSIITDQAATWLIAGTGNPADPNQYDVVSIYGLNLAQDYKIKGDIKGEMGTVSPAFAIQITPKFSLGLTANFWRDTWFDGQRYEQKHKEISDGQFSQVSALWYDSDRDCTCNDGGPCASGDYVDNPDCLDQLIDPTKVGGTNPTYSSPKSFQSEFSSETKMWLAGESYNFGILWDITPRWTMGAVYRTGARLKVDREYRWFFNQTSDTKSLNYGVSKGEANYDEHIYLPSAYGLGAGFRYSDALTFTGDLTMVRWDEYFYKLEDGTKYSLVTGLKKGIDDVDPTLTFRAGAEYLIIKPKYVVPIRGGFFYDQEPALPHPDSFYGFTVGSGFAYKWIITDLAYFYRFGQDVHIGYSANAERTELIEDAVGDVAQHQVMLSFIFHFE